jgi:hypothetical protein
VLYQYNVDLAVASEQATGSTGNIYYSEQQFDMSSQKTVPEQAAVVWFVW